MENLNQELEYKKMFRLLFDENPISLWEEDFSVVKQIIDKKKTEIDDFKIYIDNNPDFVSECISKIKIYKVNNSSLDLFGAKNKENLITHLSNTFNEKSFETFKNLLLTLASGKTKFSEATEYVKTNGEIFNAIIQFIILNDYKNVIVSITDISEQIKNENKLKIQNEKLIHAQYISKIGDFTWNIVSGKVTWSSGMFQLLKYDFNEKINYEKVNQKIHHPDDLERVTNWLMKSIASKNKPIEPYEYRLVRKDGEIIDVKTNGRVEFKDGKAIKFFGTCQDISEQKGSEQKLKIQNDEYAALNEEYKAQNEKLLLAMEIAIENEIEQQLLFSNMSTGFAFHKIIVDKNNKAIDYKFIKVNETFEQLTGLLAINLIGKKVSIALPEIEKDTVDWIAIYGKVAITGKAITFNNYSEALNKWFSINAYSPQKGYFVTIFEDISNQKFAEEKIKQQNQEYAELIKELTASEEELRAANEELVNAKNSAEEKELQLQLITDNFVSGMIYQVTMLDENTKKFNYVSDAVNKLYGCTPDEAKENPDLIYGKIHKDDISDLIKKEKEALRTMSVLKSETRVINPDGSTRWSYYVSKPRVNKGLVCWDGIELDITEHKKIEQELIIAKEKAEESDQLKTEFINNMSHEIRTPMNGILGFSEFLNKPNLSDIKQKQYITIIQNSGHQLMRIINDILEISKLGTKQVKTIEKPVCLNDLLLEHFSIFDIKAKESKIPLYYKKGLSDINSTIFTDETKINKIISNLLENALKYTNEGFIEFGYKLIKHKGDSNIQIYVKDTGIGIKPEKQESIFIRFSQEEKELSKNVGGLGLGLSIAKENAELLGGNIIVKSEKGKGSIFFITIPYNPVNSEPEKNKPSITKNQVSIKNHTVLIVEDEEVNHLYIDTLLENFDLNLNTLHAKNGQEAVEICKQNNEIDIVLMDLKMPIMNGYEATKLIKEFCPDLPIIAQTAYTVQADKDKAKAAGCVDFISKPIYEKALNEIIKKYLK